MTRIELLSGLCGAVLLASAGSAAACISDGACGARSALPSPIFAPAIALQQIENGSAPLTLLASAPPPGRDGATGPAAKLGPVAPGGIAAVGDLDGGVKAWGTIAPGAGFDRLPASALTGVAPIQPAKHVRPIPAKTEIALATNLSLAVPVVLRLNGVPGIERDASADGNRSLWFGPEGGR